MPPEEAPHERRRRETPSYPIAPDIFTTLQRAVMPDPPVGSKKILPNEVSKYKQNGYGSWHYGPGIDSVKRLDIVPLLITVRLPLILQDF